MLDPATTTYLGTPGYLVLWILTVVCFYLFGRRVLKYIRLLSEARRECRWDRPSKRAGLFLGNVFGQKKLFNEPVIGAAHFLIFWAFVFYATSFFWNLVKGLFPILPIPYADDVPSMAFALEVLGVLALVSLVVAAVRRYIFTPPHLERSRDATLILTLITLLLLSFLCGQGYKALAGGSGDRWSPVGTFLGQAFASIGVPPTRGPALFLLMWWIHMLTVLSFLAYLPYSKHLHLLASPFGVLFGSLRRGTVPSPSEGAARWEEFTWRQLFNALCCAECGRCDRACPAFSSGFALSPQKMVHHVKELVAAAKARKPPPASEGNGNGKSIGDVVRAEELWACTTCYSCMERCPVFNEHVHLIVEMRRHLVSQGEVESGLQEALTNLTRYGNSFGKSPRQRPLWALAVVPGITDARKEPVDCLWVTGDYAAFDPRAQKVTQSAARVFQHGGLSVGLLYDAEQNSGNDLRRVGEEGLFEMLMEKNLKALGKARFERIVTTDPHTYHVLKNEYNWSNGKGEHQPEVLHHTELIDGMVQSGKLSIQKKLEISATYHDPCYLGRCNEVYEAPRRLLQSLGVRVAEMPRNREQSYCCGAGGGRIWMEEVAGVKERPAESRVREAASLSGVSTLVVACPKDLVMFQDALKTTGLEERLVIKDIAELVEEAMRQ